MRGVSLNIPAILGLIAVGTLVGGSVSADQAADRVAFPEGYRTWRHVKSMIIEPGHPLAGLVEGTHHIYANDRALRGYPRRPFPDGSVIVFDLLETVSGDKAITEGARKAVIVMRKDARRYRATDGWGYEVFARGDAAQPQVRGQAATMCHACHQSQRERDFVFSDYRP
jgi:hypothetical protein